MHRIGRQPRAELGRAIVEAHLLAQAEAQGALGELAVLGDVVGEQRQMVDAAHAGAAAGELLRQVLERRAQVLRRLVFLLLVIELHDMAVGIVETIGPAMAEIAVGPADAQSRFLDRFGAALQCLGAGGAPGDAADAVALLGAQLDRARRIVAIAAQIDRMLALVDDFHAQEVAEIPERLLGLRGQDLDMAQMGDVLDRLLSVVHDLHSRASLFGPVAA